MYADEQSVLKAFGKGETIFQVVHFFAFCLLLRIQQYVLVACQHNVHARQLQKILELFGNRQIDVLFHGAVGNRAGVFPAVSGIQNDGKTVLLRRRLFKRFGGVVNQRGLIAVVADRRDERGDKHKDHDDGEQHQRHIERDFRFTRFIHKPIHPPAEMYMAVCHSLFTFTLKPRTRAASCPTRRCNSRGSRRTGRAAATAQAQAAAETAACRSSHKRPDRCTSRG